MRDNPGFFFLFPPLLFLQGLDDLPLLNGTQFSWEFSYRSRIPLTPSPFKTLFPPSGSSRNTLFSFLCQKEVVIGFDTHIAFFSSPRISLFPFLSPSRAQNDLFLLLFRRGFEVFALKFSWGPVGALFFPYWLLRPRLSYG